MHERGVRVLHRLVHHLLLLRRQVLILQHVAFGAHQEQRLAGEERVDVAEQRELLLDRVRALAAQVNEVENGGLQVRHGGDGLHLVGVALLERVVQDSGRVDHLPANVVVVHVTEEERLGRERVGLHVHVRARHFVHEAGLADIGEAAQDQGTVRRVDRGETRHVLSHLLQVAERGIELLHDGAHTTQRRVLQLLASVEGIAVLQQTDVVLTDLGDNVLGGVDLTQGQFVVISVVQHVDQIGEEGMDLLILRTQKRTILPSGGTRQRSPAVSRSCSAV